MDVSDASENESVMIALLPMTSDWCKIDLPHLTLVYAGLKKDHSPGAFNDLAKDAAMIAMLSRPIFLRVMGVEIFGTDEKVKAFRLQPTPELMAMRRSVVGWNASQHPFNPHVTIGPQDTFVEHVPPALSFDRVMVGWGEDMLTFWLKR